MQQALVLLEVRVAGTLALTQLARTSLASASDYKDPNDSESSSDDDWPPSGAPLAHADDDGGSAAARPSNGWSSAPAALLTAWLKALTGQEPAKEARARRKRARTPPRRLSCYLMFQALGQAGELQGCPFKVLCDFRAAQPICAVRSASHDLSHDQDEYLVSMLIIRLQYTLICMTLTLCRCALNLESARGQRYAASSL